MGSGYIDIPVSGGSTSPLTTKGDLYAFSSVNARLPVGTDGQVLTADSTQATGLKYSTVTGTGTVTSVGLSLTGLGWLTIGGTPVTTTGTLALSLTTGQTQNQFLASPNGSSGTVGLRAIVAADIPTLNQNTSGSAASLSATLAIASGGTNVTSVTVAPAATAFAGWDANKNLSANALIEGYATTATAAGTTTLVVGSAYTQYFTGSTTQTVTMPVTSTLVLGQQFLIVNRSSGVVTVQSSGANSIQAMAANTQILLTCILTSGTTAASWDAVYNSNALPPAAGATTTLNNLGSTAINADLSFGTDATNNVGESNANRALGVYASGIVVAGWNGTQASKTGVSLNGAFAGNSNPGVRWTNGTNGINLDYDGTYLAMYNAGSGGHGLKMGLSTFIFQDSATNNVLTTIDTTGIYLGNAALVTTATAGYAYINTCAGAPTGVPSGKTGMVAHIYDTTNNKLWVYNGAWKGVVLS